MGGDYDSSDNTKAKTERAVQLAANFVGALSGIGTNCSKNLAMTADAPRCREGDNTLTGQAIDKLIGPL